MSYELQDLARRLEEIEKQVAHLAALVTEQSDKDRTIEAQSFVVKDKEARRRAELGMVVSIGSEEANPWLGLFDENESLQACMGVGGTGATGPIRGPWFELYNQKGRVGVEIDLNDDNPEVRLFNEEGKATLAVATSELGPSVTLCNPDGKQHLSIGISLSGNPSLVMSDADGDAVLKISVESYGPRLAIGKDNKVYWSAP